LNRLERALDLSKTVSEPAKSDFGNSPINIDYNLSQKKGFRARRETVIKRSIHVVCEHFEPFRNTAMGTYIFLR